MIQKPLEALADAGDNTLVLAGVEDPQHKFVTTLIDAINLYAELILAHVQLSEPMRFFMPIWIQIEGKTRPAAALVLDDRVVLAFSEGVFQLKERYTMSVKFSEVKKANEVKRAVGRGAEHEAVYISTALTEFHIIFESPMGHHRLARTVSGILGGWASVQWENATETPDGSNKKFEFDKKQAGAANSSHPSPGNSGRGDAPRATASEILAPPEFAPVLKRLRIDLSRVDSAPDGEAAISVREAETSLGSRSWAELRFAVTEEIRNSGYAGSEVAETGHHGSREIRIKVKSRRNQGPEMSAITRSESLSRLAQVPALPATAVRKRAALDLRRGQTSGEPNFTISVAERDIAGAPATWLGSLAAACETVEESGLRVTSVDISGAPGARIAHLGIAMEPNVDRRRSGVNSAVLNGSATSATWVNGHASNADRRSPANDVPGLRQPAPGPNATHAWSGWQGDPSSSAFGTGLGADPQVGRSSVISTIVSNPLRTALFVVAGFAIGALAWTVLHWLSLAFDALAGMWIADTFLNGFSWTTPKAVVERLSGVGQEIQPSAGRVLAVFMAPLVGGLLSIAIIGLPHSTAIDVCNALGKFAAVDAQNSQTFTSNDDEWFSALDNLGSEAAALGGNDVITQQARQAGKELKALANGNGNSGMISVSEGQVRAFMPAVENFCGGGD